MKRGWRGTRIPSIGAVIPGARRIRACLTGIESWGSWRKICPALREGRFHPLPAGDEVVAFLRQDGGSSLLCAVNRAGAERTVALPEEWRGRTVNHGGGWIAEDTLHLPSEDCAICIRDTERE